MSQTATPTLSHGHGFRMTDERYITADELAHIMGISAKTVRRMTIEGMPSETWGLKRARRYLASECLAWARARAEPVSANGAPAALHSQNR